MELKLNNLRPALRAKKKKRRVGRGGKRGTYSGRGMKGQRARSGGKKGLKLKGIKPMLLTIPKQRGFKSLNPKKEIVNLDNLEKNFQENEEVNPKSLRQKGLVDKIERGVKILGQGNLKKKLIISRCLLSKNARKKIQERGGEIK